jgi:ElaB/YqjD/DUF883 family membrane-anchored ribosome-binding protein
MSNVHDDIEDTIDKAKATSKKYYQKGEREVVKGSEDWVEYIKTHPLQSIAFGACKGIFD